MCAGKQRGQRRLRLSVSTRGSLPAGFQSAETLLSTSGFEGRAALLGSAGRVLEVHRLRFPIISVYVRWSKRMKAVTSADHVPS